MSPGCVDADLAQHLPADHLDVLVVGVDALRAVHLLHFVDDVALDLVPALGQQDLVRILGPIGELLARVDVVAVFDIDLVSHWHRVLVALFLLVANVDRSVVEEESPVDGAVELLVIRTDRQHRLVL